MVANQVRAGDEILSDTDVIEVHVSELGQIFNSMDPSPFHDKDLDVEAEEFIVGWARELPRDKPLALRVHLDRPSVTPEMARDLRQRFTLSSPGARSSRASGSASSSGSVGRASSSGSFFSPSAS